MTTKNFYEEFAGIYDKLMTDVDYTVWAKFIIDNLNKDTKRILEAACGTGGITYELAQKFFNITAFDISDQMLIQAYNKLRRFRNVQILNMDMSKFKISGKFDACICCCDGLNYLDLSAVRSFFEKTYAHLADNSKFIFDISTDYKYKSMDKTYIYEDDDVFYVWENTKNDDLNTMNMEINFFIEEGDLYKRIVEKQIHYMHSTKDIIDILTEIGFKNIKLTDGYSERKYTDTSIRATFVCEKGDTK